MSTIVEPQSQRLVRAGLQEIFSSIQGEGIWVGKRQIFVRFNACHLKCAYCDTPQRVASAYCEIEQSCGSSEKTLLENPVSVESVLNWIWHFVRQTRHHSISFTGGEPLLYTDFLKSLLPEVVSLLPVYLETSGTQPDKLAEIIDWVNIIAMDIKLPSATGEAMQLENHRQFYQASSDKELFVKLVFSEQTPLSELEAVSEIVTHQRTPIILQPMTSLTTGENTVSAAKIFEVEEFLSARFADVRVIPQTHKMLALL